MAIKFFPFSIKWVRNNQKLGTWLFLLMVVILYIEIPRKCVHSKMEETLREQLKKKDKLIEQKTKTLQSWKKKNAQKKILIISQLYKDKEHTEYGTNFFAKKECSQTNCIITQDKYKFGSEEAFDAVLFHTMQWGFELNGISTAERKNPKQRYVFLIKETSVYDNLNYTTDERLNNFFNWTMTFRLDSDIPWPYGWFTSKSSSTPLLGQGVWEPFSSGKNLEKYTTVKSRMVTWFVSKCKTQSRREEYATELRKHLQVQIYGRCGDHVCMKEKEGEETGKCDKIIEESYFYLSFENSLCQDYITEKVYKVLQMNTIPVVYGGANYAKVLPPHSYIDVGDFSTPKKLAEYLNYLAGNQTAYLEYFWWKDKYNVVSDSYLFNNPFWCQLCQMLHQDLPPKTYSNLGDWRVKCHEPKFQF